MCQPGKFKKVILTQSNDVLSLQLQHLKSYFEEQLIVPKWCSLFCPYEQSGGVFGQYYQITGGVGGGKEKNVIFPVL